MPAPHEIVAGPLTIYLAPQQTAAPGILAAPASPWVKLGTEGAHNYSDDGVTVSHSQSIEDFRSAASPRPRKVWRTSEDLKIGLTLVDLSPAMYAKALDEAAVTLTPAASGVAGTAEIEFARGIDVQVWALLARGQSSVDNGMVCQIHIPSVYQSGEPELSFSKGEPAGLALEFTAMEAALGEFGTIEIQTAAPL